MSSALALASVTAVLKSLLDNRLIEQSVAASIGEVSVTALPPDRVPVGADEKSQLNLFMYRVTPQTAWRSSGAVARGSDVLFRPVAVRPLVEGGALAAHGDHREGAAPVAAAGRNGSASLGLELHYLLTAYGSQDLHAEILLGHALQLWLETPILKHDVIRAALRRAAGANGSSASPANAALAASTLADQLEQIDVEPEFLNTEEMSKLWSSLQAHYRPSATYKVSAVILDHEGGKATDARPHARSAKA